MEQHPFFNLQLHTDAELESHLGSPLLERRTLHEWPLSCVQRLSLVDGRKLVYKAQFGPTVEPEFYRSAHSPTLMAVDTLFRDEQYACTLMEYLDAPRLWELHIAPDALYRTAQELQAEIQRIEGEVPVYHDISAWSGWQALMGQLVKDLRALVSTGTYQTVNTRLVDIVERQADSPEVKAAIKGPCGLIHGDLAGDNVFVLPDGYRIIDWQRPLRGPLGLDLALLADSFSLDPAAWTGPGLAKILYLLRIQWLVECTQKWFPDGTNTYDRETTRLIGLL